MKIAENSGTESDDSSVYTDDEADCSSSDEEQSSDESSKETSQPDSEGKNPKIDENGLDTLSELQLGESSKETSQPDSEGKHPKIDENGWDTHSEISDSEFFGEDKKEDPEPETTVPFIPKFDEYEFDTSDEEDIRNTVGNIPMHWYDHFPHIGYDVDGNKLLKPASTDEIDNFLSKMDDPNYWRTVKNKMTGEKVVLSDEDLDIIRRIQAGKFPTQDVKEEIFEDFFTYEEEQFPVTNHPPHKRSFIPSLVEKAMVSKYLYGIKMGWIKKRVPKEEKDHFFMLWDKEVTNASKRLQHYIPAPKRRLPGHEESYNPPPEYLLTKEEEEKWKEEEPEKRKLDFIPRKYSAFRQIPGYTEYTKEFFERCLDLYLCPRLRKMRANVDPNALLPQLPKPKDLQPFPSTLAIIYIGHTELVRCISMEPGGQFFASGSDDGTLKIWEVCTGRSMRTVELGGPVKHVAWCPSEALSVVLASVGEKIYVINTKVGDKVVVSNTDLLFNSVPEIFEDRIVKWSLPNDEQKAAGIRLIIDHAKEVKQIVWHAKSDYFGTLTGSVGSRAIVIHQLSKFKSQAPFQKLKGNVQCILFHPLRPFFFVATQKHIKMYNLLKHEGAKVLTGNVKWISSMAVHPQGDNLIVGSFDSKLNWFDMELSTKPYKSLRYHTEAIRQVCFSRRYPLFASTADDGSVIISHGMVYSDLMQNPTIIPVKVLKSQGMSLDCCFHPQRPWIFVSSSKNIRLYS